MKRSHRVSLKILLGKTSLLLMAVTLGISFAQVLRSRFAPQNLFSSAQAAEIEAQPNVPLACPAATIDGVIGSGSADHPFVTGNQTSRIFRNTVESTCGTAKPFPGLSDVGTTFKFDAYSFTNTSASTICVTVISTPTANNQLLTAAYDASFNPNNIQQNYLGDAGQSDGTRAFSFLVPGNHNFVVVQSRVNNAANPPSLAYSFRVLGLPTCNSCPPSIISGIIGSGSTQYPAAIATQSGRLFRNAIASACSPAKPAPSISDAGTSFQYDAYTFLNTSASSVCVTVNTTAGAGNQILTAAYLDRYNPSNVQENYLGDAGNSDQSRSFSFTVPARRSFVVVQSRVNTAGNPTSLDYFFSVSGLTGCTACPVITIGPDEIPSRPISTAYSQQLTRTGGAASGTWSVADGSLPTGLSLHPTTGLLSGTPTISGNFNFSARFTDSNGCLGEKRYFFSIVVCQSFTLGPDPLPSATLNLTYNQQLTATGGTAPYTFNLFAGAPPTGITLSSNGVLSGVPTSLAPANFTARATDANGCTGTKTYTLIVCNTVTVNPATAPNGFVGTAYAQSFSQSGAASPTWSVSAGTLPDGLSLNPSSGLLSGIPTAVGSFDFTIRATGFNGCFGERSYTVIISGNGLMFYPLARPVRLLDTRAGQGNCDNVGAPITTGNSISLLARTTCESITIPTNAQAVVGNVTVINQGGQSGFLTLHPNGVPLPLAANMIYGPGQILANNFTVGLGTNGQFDIFSERMIDVIIDVSGYFAPPSTNGLYFHPLPKPVRLLDTRAGQGNCDTVSNPIVAGTSLTTQARITCEGVTIPASAKAIVGNATVVNGSGQTGYLTVYPAGGQVPLAANIIYFPGQILSNAFTVGLSSNGQFSIFGEKTIDMIVDVAGYYSSEAVDANGTGLLFSPLSRPLRILDTRANQGNCDNVSAAINGNSSLAASARLTCEGITIPAEAQSVLGVVTVINLTGQAGFLTLYPDNVAQPLAANMIYFPGQVLSNAFLVGLDTNTGQFRIFAERSLHAIVDVSGYYAP